MEEEELEGLNYDELILDENVHKLVGVVEKFNGVNSSKIEVDDGAMWLVTGLGYLKNKTPDESIVESLKNTIIIDKTQLIEFIKNKKNG